jgi:hypothetical protein
MTTRRSFSSDALARAARALRFSMVIQGAVRWGVLSAGGLLALLLVDNLLRLPQAMRLPLAVVLGGFVLIEFYRKVLVLLLRPFSPAHAARWLETHRGIAGNVLINAYQFETDQSQGDWRKYVRPTLDSSGNILQQISPSSIWLTSNLKKWMAGLVLLVVAWTLLAVSFPRYLVTGMERIFMPLADVPPVGSWNVDVTPGSTVTVVEGDKLDISVKVKSALGLEGKVPVPDLVWQNKGASSSTTESTASSGQHASMLPSGKLGEFNFSFSAVSQPFTFTVVADDSRSASVRVEVIPLPQLKGSTFQITPPAYTGLKPFAQPGPPETLEVPEGSTVKVRLELLPQSPKVVWKDGTSSTDTTAAASTDMTQADNGWELTRQVNASSTYQLLVTMPGLPEARTLAQGQITSVPDRPPEVDFVTQDRNRAVSPGGQLPVTIRATDDYGLSSISLQISPGDDPSTVKVLKTWTYIGPPGQKEPTPENYTITLDPSSFTPGSTYLLTAQATDFSPAKHGVTSRPIIVRVASLQDMAVPSGDVLAKLFDLLKSTITQQTSTNGETSNLTVHLSEALEAKDVPKHLDLMKTGQSQAQDLGGQTLTEAQAHDEAKIYIAKLEPLVKGEMDLALGQVGGLQTAVGQDALSTGLAALTTRQVYILNGLVALLGQMANDRQQAADAAAKKPKTDAPTAPVVTEEMAKLKDELKAFADRQKKLISDTNKFKELNPEDLTSEQADQLGRLAREEAKEAAYFQEKLTDLSKLSLQDFADGKVVKDMNGVYQEVQKASESLYQKRTEIAVAGMTAGLEKAEKIEQNLERWLPNTPDNTKWSMEEPAGQQDVPMAELPKQLDDLIGDLLHKENEMDQDKDDVSSSIMDSMDKGAGWGASDGPMSNMSAKGVTGNQLPNNDEKSGRSGEGRSGKSDGQMVGDTAVGKGGNETPTRMTATPFENGSVNDKSKDSKGGATGGGKLAGAGQDGLRGIPPAQKARLGILADSQSKIRQQAESLAIHLRKQRRPTGDLESAINGMQKFEDAVHNNDGLGVVQGYHQALDALSAARTAYAGERLSRVEADSLTRDVHKDMVDTQAEEAPAGYEEMSSAYFRSLSESPATPASSGDAPTDGTTAPTSTSAPDAAPVSAPTSTPQVPSAPVPPLAPATSAVK